MTIVSTCFGSISAAARLLRKTPADGAILNASQDQTLKIWDAMTGQCILTLSVVNGVASLSCGINA